MAIEFKLNGSAVALDVPADTPLLWAVRDELNLKGTKFGCGIGMCGACTVHIDGVAQRSCITTVAAVAGKNITTIEGLSENGDHPLQQAWLPLRRLNVATVSRVRSCRRPACWRLMQHRPMRILTRQ